MELYRHLPYLDELEDCLSLLGSGVHVLELGCGTGRLTRRMLQLGARVTAVDNSVEMLRAVPDGATKICADIESLDLTAAFQTVVLAGCLINHPLIDIRTAFARAARRHLTVGGRLLLQRQDSDWLQTAQMGSSGKIGLITVVVESVGRATSPMTMTLRYELGSDVWWHSFSVVPLSETAIEFLLSAAGFDDFEWLGPKRLWLTARAEDVPAHLTEPDPHFQRTAARPPN